LIRDQSDAGNYLEEVYRIALKKSTSYEKHGHFLTRPIILLCYSDCCPFFNAKGRFEAAAFWYDFGSLGFAEIWLMDLAEDYYSARDPRRPADLYGFKPVRWRGYRRFSISDRKSFG